jgi:hypothetical protein
MAQIAIDDLTSGGFADVNVLQGNLDTIVNEINGNLDNTNFSASAAIDPAKIANGGAVVLTDLTQAGAANKIPQLDTNGYLNLAENARIYFYKKT